MAAGDVIHSQEQLVAPVRGGVQLIDLLSKAWDNYNQKLAAKGETLFTQNCSRCHGTYGADWTYPNRVVPLEEIGTDRTRFDGVSPRFGEHYNKSWFAQETGGGYQAKETAATAPHTKSRLQVSMPGQAASGCSSSG